MHFAQGVIQNGHMKPIRSCWATSQELADILTEPLHFPQWLARVAGILGNKIVTATEGPLSSRGGAVAKVIKLSHVVGY
jgi:hypothetical protein